MAGVSANTAVRVLGNSPPTWTGGFQKISNYVNLQKNENSGLFDLAATLRGQRDTAQAAAALLRAVATLLERP